MPVVTGTKYTGPITIDLKDVEKDLVDLPPNATRGLRAEQEGMPGVIVELAKAIPAVGEEAGIPAKSYQRFLDQTALLGKLDAHEAVLEKALEVVRETRAKTAHERENEISLMVDSVKSTAARTGNTAVAAAFQKTIEYNAQIAERAAQTRRKNEEAKKAAEEVAKKAAEEAAKKPEPVGGE